MQIKKPRNTHEEDLETLLKKVAPFFGCLYITIPDVNKGYMYYIRKYNIYSFKPYRRPFDGLLYTPLNTFSIECKIDSNVFLPHQRRNQADINKINKSFYVIRKVFRKHNTIYKVEFNDKVVFKINDISEVIEFFKELQ